MAHTQSENEREALTYLITAFRFRERGLRGTAMEPDLAVSRPLAELLLAEGFRRSEVPEPSVEPHCNHCGRPLCATLKPGEFCACECHPPQGEPSDAQVDAACHAFGHHPWGTDPRGAMHAALRAASAVTEQGEKP